MSTEKRAKAKGLAKAFEKMSHRKKGGTKGTFTENMVHEPTFMASKLRLS